MRRDIRGFFKPVDKSQSASLPNFLEPPSYEVNEETISTPSNLEAGPSTISDKLNVNLEDLGSKSEEELDLRLEESQDTTEIKETDE